jgi:hypothetical protein
LQTARVVIEPGPQPGPVDHPCDWFDAQFHVRVLV